MRYLDSIVNGFAMLVDVVAVVVAVEDEKGREGLPMLVGRRRRWFRRDDTRAAAVVVVITRPDGQSGGGGGGE